MKARLDLNPQQATVRQPPPPTWGVPPVLPPSEPIRGSEGTPVGGNSGAGVSGGGATGLGGLGNGRGTPQAELDAFMSRLDDMRQRLDDMNALMADTIRHYYWVNRLPQGHGVVLGIHELLFPHYWKWAKSRGFETTSDPWAAAGARPVTIQIDVRPCPPRPVIPPLVGPAIALQAPIAPVPISADALAKLPPPPLPARLRQVLESALATPWDSQESSNFYFQADRNVSPRQVQGALAVLPELESALGMALGKTPLGAYGTSVDVTAGDGYKRLAAQRLGDLSTATGAYLVRLAEVYQQYKAEYYGLKKAIDRDLYHRDPCSHRPRVHMGDALKYLEEKYALAMEGLIWRTTRTSSPIMLDLDGDGSLSVTGRSTAKERAAENGFVSEGSVMFDLDGDGRKERIEWMAGDGMLVDDRDGGASAAAAGDGEIDGRRLFGDEGGRYANGYQKLQQLDANQDGRLSASELDGLKVWVDDGDAKLEEGELKSLAELGITEIVTQMTEQVNASGERLMRSTYVQNGESKISEDVWFAQG
ncbi:hypothetical protein D3C72_59720 [compost metagenome]